MVDFVRDTDLELEDAELVAEFNEQPQFFMPQPLRNTGLYSDDFRARWWPGLLPDGEQDAQS